MPRNVDVRSPSDVFSLCFPYLSSYYELLGRVVFKKGQLQDVNIKSSRYFGYLSVPTSLSEVGLQRVLRGWSL